MKRSYLVAAVIVVVLAVVAVQVQPSRGLRVTFFDIGQGDSTLIYTPAQQAILIDGGPDRTVLARLGRHLPWNERTLDLVILSHPHADHVTGLVYVLEHYRVRHVLMTGAVHTTPEYLRLLELIREQNIPVTLARAGQRFTLAGGVEVTVVWPQQSYAGVRVTDLNDTSIVNLVAWGDTRVLFTGDTPEASERELLGSGAVINSQLLKVAHQGSDTSSGEAFLRAVAPTVAVISVGAHNRYGHPHPKVLARLRRLVHTVLRTDQDGDITYVSDGRTWRRQ